MGASCQSREGALNHSPFTLPICDPKKAIRQAPRNQSGNLKKVQWVLAIKVLRGVGLAHWERKRGPCRGLDLPQRNESASEPQGQEVQPFCRPPLPRSTLPSLPSLSGFLEWGSLGQMDSKVIYSSPWDQLRLSGGGGRTNAEVAKNMDQMAT